MLSGAYNASHDCQYDYDDEDQHAFDDDKGDLTVEGPTLYHSSTASGFLHTNIGRHRSSLLNQPSPHSVHPPPHSLQLSPHTVHLVSRPRTHFTLTIDYPPASMTGNILHGMNIQTVKSAP